MVETQHTFCRICEALCGLEARIEDGRVVALAPDPHHVTTAGFACVKGLRQHALYGSPDRVRRPQKRDGHGHREASWEEAFADIGARVRRIVDEHGPDAIAMYVGTAAGFGVLHPIFAQGFMTGLGSKSMYSSATQDCANKFAVSREMYGFPFTLPFPDVRHTDCLIVVGANPVVSKWSFLQVPNPVQHLRAIEARGGRVFIVDPRRTETAKTAGEHIFIRPGTDVFFYLSFLCELFAQGGVDEARARTYMTGLDALRELAQAWPPERTAAVTHIGADTLRELVRAYRTAKSAALYASTGVNMSRRGALAFWLQESINAVSGNLDRRGGTLVGRGVVDFPAFAAKHGILMRDDRSRVGGFQSVNDAFPGGLLADEILTPGRGQVRALFVTGGNPLLTMPNAGRLAASFEQLDLLVTLDIFRNETGSLAHWVLPTTTPLERPDLPFIFPLMLGLQAQPYLQATHALQAPDGDQRDEAAIYLDLARACGVSLFGSKVAQRALELWTRVHSWRAGRRRVPQEALLSLLLRAVGQSPFDELVEHHHGVRGAPHAEDFLGRRVLTSDGRVALAPEMLLEEAARVLEPAFADERAELGELKLITRRAVTTHNSWTHNLEEFVAGDRGTNYLYMHPADALSRGLRDDDFVDVATDVAAVRLPLRTTPDLMPGVVALPHGWGHQHATGLSVASRTRGVNVNLLAGDGPSRLERASGMAHLSGFSVDVRRAAGPADPTSWSGLPPGEVVQLRAPGASRG